MASLHEREVEGEKFMTSSQEVEVEDHPMSASRKRWLVMVWAMTWLIPDVVVRKVGGMPRKDVRMAWREKLAINMIIWFSCGFVVFFMIGFPKLICPTQHVYSNDELESYNGKDGAKAFVAIRGTVFSLTNFAPSHYPSIVPQKSVLKYAGTDATNLFPVQVSALCQGTGTTGIDKAVQLNYQSYNYTDQKSVVSSTDTTAQYHDF